MKKKKKAIRRLCLAALLMTALVLNGCSLRPGPARTPEGKALFRMGFSGAAESLNPYAAGDSEAEAAFALLYDTLFRVENETQEIVESLCKSYTVTNSASGVGKLWHIELREDVYWSDGEKLTASDVEFSLQSQKDLSTLYSAPYCEMLDTTGISVEDDTHLAMIVWGEEAYVKACLSRIPILPRHIWNELPCMRYDASGVPADPIRAHEEIYDISADASTMVGTGLYTWGDFHDGVLTLRLNDAYWDGASRAEVVELHYALPDTAGAILRGEIDGCWDMSFNDFRQMSENEAVRVTSGTEGSFYQLGFHFSQDRSPIQDAAVRQAAEYCTSRDTLLLYAFGGGYSQRGMISPYSPNYTMDEVVFDRPFEIETAASLLQNAGWVDSNGDGVREKNGTELKLTLLCSEDSLAWDRAAQILKVCFASAGMEMEIRLLPPEQYAVELSAGQWDLCLTERTCWPDPWFSLGCFYWNNGDNLYAQPDGQGGYTSLGWNDCGYDRAEYDRLYEKLLTLSEPSALREQTAKCEEYLYNDSAAVTIGFSVDYQACSRVWTGLKAYVGGGLYFTPGTLREQMQTIFTGKR